MKKNIKYSLPLIIIIAGFFTGCLKDNNVVTSPDIVFDNGAEIINYFEEKGDYINSNAAPSVIEAQQLFNNPDGYKILDIRDSAEFKAGHIAGSVNISHNDLITYIESLQDGGNDSIVVVSKNGQSSAYYTALLRLYGFNNVYSLIFGLASWNVVFADDWLKAILPGSASEFTAEDIEKDGYYKLPAVTYDNPTGSIKEKIQSRIKKFIAEEYLDSFGSFTMEGPSVDRDIFLADDNNAYKICYSDPMLYSSTFFGLFHPPGSVNYIPGNDLRSSLYLQTLPVNTRIMLYSTEGSLSAFATAYLRLLGYNASSMLFGCNAFQHNEMFGLYPQVTFTIDKIKNYPYAQ